MTDQEKKWIEDYCNETISPEEFARFERALEDSSDFRAVTRRYLAMDSRLQQGSESIDALKHAWNGGEVPTEKRRSPWQVWALAAGLVFMLGLGLGGLLNPAQEASAMVAEPEDDGIAVLKHAADALWGNEPDGGLTTGSILAPGHLHLTSGLAQIEFYNGARLILDGPVDLELVSVNRAICHSGKLRALVPPNARGFTLLSSQFELVDLGTEFGIEVGRSGDAKVEVFDGEVELYPPDGKRSPERLTRLFGGSGISWNSSGQTESTTSQPENFPTFEEVENRNQIVTRRRIKSWQDWNQSAPIDPRIVVHYDFESDGSLLMDGGPDARHGTIVGSERSEGRWPGKGALEFKRPGDRVRIDVPGEFDALTLTTWIRVDALPGRTQAILLTDGYEVGRPHWQLSGEGTLRLGVRLPSQKKRMRGSGYGSPVLFSPRRIGSWTLITTVYDNKLGEVRHYLNGREVSREDLQFNQQLTIGLAEIGNWGIPLASDRHPVRNFIGRIDSMTIWNEALPEKEIAEIFRKTRP